MTTSFDRVTQTWSDLRYMSESQAAFLRTFVAEKRIAEVIEIGFYRGKSSAYFAAILEDQGLGHLTTLDLDKTPRPSPDIAEVLAAVDLAHRVTAIRAKRSYTWELAKMLKAGTRDRFDLCYFDGGHTWDNTGFGFFLIHLLLKPGGWIIFDDMNWSIGGSPSWSEKKAAKYSEDEKEAQTVRMVYEMLVPELGYANMSEVPKFRWGVAQKPTSSL